MKKRVYNLLKRDGQFIGITAPNTHSFAFCNFGLNQTRGRVKSPC